MIEDLEKAYELGATFLLIVGLAYAVRYYQRQLSAAGDDEDTRVAAVKAEYQERIDQLVKERDDWRDKYLEAVNEKEQKVAELNRELRESQKESEQILQDVRDQVRRQEWLRAQQRRPE